MPYLNHAETAPERLLRVEVSESKRLAAQLFTKYALTAGGDLHGWGLTETLALVLAK